MDDVDLNLEAIERDDLYGATWSTICYLNGEHRLGPADIALVKLALTLAERIDADGLETRVSLFERMHWLLLDLKGERPSQVLKPMQAAEGDRTA